MMLGLVRYSVIRNNNRRDHLINRQRWVKFQAFGEELSWVDIDSE